MTPAHPRRTSRGSILALGALGMAAACAPSLADGPPDGNLVIAVSVTGQVQRPDAGFVRPADASHRCAMPSRAWLPSASGPAPPRDGPASHVFGYQVIFGPDFPPPAPGRPTPTDDWYAYGPQAHFSLEVLPLPGQEAGAGPVRLGRSFRLTMSAGDRLWARHFQEGDPDSEGSVTINPDGLGGAFRLTGMEQQIPHNRFPPEIAIAVTGRWRCPRP